MRDGPGSVSRWLGDLKAGDEEALQPLWGRYFARLIERAGAKLCASRAPTAVNDGEDVALSAFQALHEGVREGRFPRLDDRDDLWRVLVHLAACKALDRRRDERRQKRGGGKVVREADWVDARDEPGPGPLDQVIGRGPTPEFAATVAEEYERRLDTLGDPTLRKIAERKLACCTNAEIARELGVSLRTVALKLELIRKRWQQDSAPP